MQARVRPPAAPGRAPEFLPRAVSHGRLRARSGLSRPGRWRTQRNETAAQYPAPKAPFPDLAAALASPERAASLQLARSLPTADLVWRAHAREAAPRHHRRAPPTPGLPAAGNRAVRWERSGGF